MDNKMRVAVVGCGEFSQHFIPLFKMHPVVENVFVCDLLEERAKNYSEKFDVEIVNSFEDILGREDINAVAVFTQRHTHADLVVRALEHGKAVYSAVPMAVTVEDCKKIVDAAERTGNLYMMGETCVYYPSSMYCKEANEQGKFGNFVYGESQYFHDLSHFPADFQADRRSSAVPPFFYPTHSTAMILHATGSTVTKVTAFGYVDKEENTPFAVGENHWDNVFSNEYSLMQLKNGGVARVCECRRIGYKAPSSFVSGFYGTRGSYQFNNAQHLVTKLTKKGVDISDVSDYVNPKAMTENKNDENFKQDVANHVYQWNNFAPVQQKEADRLPQSFKDNPEINGHMASHQLMIDDFCTCFANKTEPYVNARRAAQFTVPGLIAHESALLGGVPLDVPEF
ncbi:MAG: Gfo/Idh/MocA family oxidoreductase [Clostridia bacterium]|nr:Gfo/Idh/MocA family oxidoreductase [Clostridia bacterium]